MGLRKNKIDLIINDKFEITEQRREHDSECERPYNLGLQTHCNQANKTYFDSNNDSFTIYADSSSDIVRFHLIKHRDIVDNLLLTHKNGQFALSKYPQNENYVYYVSDIIGMVKFKYVDPENNFIESIIFYDTKTTIIYIANINNYGSLNHVINEYPCKQIKIQEFLKCTNNNNDSKQTGRSSEDETEEEHDDLNVMIIIFGVIISVVVCIFILCFLYYFCSTLKVKKISDKVGKSTKSLKSSTTKPSLQKSSKPKSSSTKTSIKKSLIQDSTKPKSSKPKSSILKSLMQDTLKQKFSKPKSLLQDLQKLESSIKNPKPRSEIPKTSVTIPNPKLPKPKSPSPASSNLNSPTSKKLPKL